MIKILHNKFENILRVHSNPRPCTNFFKTMLLLAVYLIYHQKEDKMLIG